MREHYEKMIADFDRSVLSHLRKLWMEATDPKETEKWRVRIDESLDERLRLMRMRDGLT